MDDNTTKTEDNVLMIDQFLANLHYPIGTGELLDAAVEAGLDTLTVEKLQQIPEDTYETDVEISDALGDVDMS